MEAADQNVVEDSGAVDEVESLENHAHFGSKRAQLPPVHLVDGLTVDVELARREWNKPVNGPDERRLARAGQSHDNDKFPWVDFQRHFVEAAGAPGVLNGRAH